MTAVLDQMADQQEQDRSEGLARFYELAKSVAKDQKHKPAAVQTVLDAAGKTLDDLRRQVSIHQRRALMRQQIEQAGRDDQRRAELRRLVDEADTVRLREQQIALDKYHQAVAHAQGELDDLNNNRHNPEALRAELIKNCPDERLSDRAAQIGANIHGLAMQASEAGEQVDRIKLQLTRARSGERRPGRYEWERAGAKPKPVVNTAAVEELTKRLHVAEARYSEAAERAANAREELQAIERQMLDA